MIYAHSKKTYPKREPNEKIQSNALCFADMVLVTSHDQYQEYTLYLSNLHKKPTIEWEMDSEEDKMKLKEKEEKRARK